MNRPFDLRVHDLPILGLGVSTEYGALEAPGSLDIETLHARHPEFAAFLEVGVEVSKGLDTTTKRWVASGRPTTFHFLDVNLDDPADFDRPWLDQMRQLIAEIRPAWLCGDAGLWHFGRRERGHMLLLPPILSDDSASEMAEGVARLREATGHEVLPENPPGSVYVGDLHVLDYFGRVCERADTGMLLDCAHLAIYQRAMGHSPLTALDGFPLDRIVEIHIAGGEVREHDGLQYVEDVHSPRILDDTWSMLEALAPRAKNLRAVVFECERNAIEDVTSAMERMASILAGSSLAAKVARSAS